MSPADVAEARRLRAVAEDCDAWSLFADGDELSVAAQRARAAADVLEGALPLGVRV